MNVKQFLKTNAPLLLLAVMLVGVSAAYINQFQLNKTAMVTISENSYQAELYSDTSHTVIVTALDFGEAVMGDPASDGTLSTDEVYLYLPMLESGDSAYGRWICSDLPDGMTLMGYYDNNFVGEMFEWGEDVNSGAITASENLFRVKFVLTLGDNGAGEYGFTVNFSLGSVS